MVNLGRGIIRELLKSCVMRNLFHYKFISIPCTDEEEDDDCDVSDHDSDNAVSRVSLPNSASLKENVLTKGKRKKRESTRKLSQKEMKHNKRKVNSCHRIFQN